MSTKTDNLKQLGITIHKGIAIPLDIANIDTDAIIPKQFLQRVTRDGFGQNLFHEWRFLDNDGKKANPDFILNAPVYKNASVLLARENFGCGSSREHAPWALMDYGFKVIIAPSFADIFYSNSINNQLVPIALPSEEIDQIFEYLNSNVGSEITVDLPKQRVQIGSKSFNFEMDSFKLHCLINGLDMIGLTLQHQDKIEAYEQKIPSFYEGNC